MIDFPAPVSTRPAFKRPLTMALVASALGFTLLLSACSSPSPEPTPTTGETAAEVPAELGKLEAAAVEEAARSFASERPGAIVIDGATIRAGVPDTEKWLKTVIIKPDRCGYYGGQSLTDQLSVAELAVVTLPADSGQGAAQITVSSYGEAETLVTDMATQQYMDKDCGTFTVTSGGKTVKNKIEAIAVESSAPYVSGILTAATIGAKTTRSLTIRAVDGHVMVTSTRDAGADVAAATAVAQSDVELMLELLRGRG